nr:uncharacterized protein LOC110076075 [Pogona vitticeps]XP_020643589.1 uncharacterized protein LOC110076075 [Pogona vitticeps]XP_020643591.1 uncharacterized protein LOC110076075 [Pogona vitticeps]XP_020643592.1 uncharacterized protein LOC110076075 [Pogona vitticeps]
MRKNGSSPSSMNTTCQHRSLCYDRLIEKCVSCKEMQRGTEKEPTTILRVANPTTRIPAGPFTEDHTCSALAFGLYIFVGLILALAVLWLVTNLRQKKKKRMKKADEEDPKENKDSFENEVHEDHSCGQGDDAPGLLKCPHENGTSNTAGDEILMRNMYHIVKAGSDASEVVPRSPLNEERSPAFPVPATELGTTMLVTAKTTQGNFLSEKLP